MNSFTYDCASMLVHISEEGVSDEDIACAIDVRPGSVRRLIHHYLAGGLPNGTRGIAIMKLWSEVTGLPLAQAPMRRWKSDAEPMFSAQLLRHIMRGGMPNLPRALAIIGLWGETTGKCFCDAPSREPKLIHRVERNRPRRQTASHLSGGAPAPTVWPADRVRRHVCADD